MTSIGISNSFGLRIEDPFLVGLHFKMQGIDQYSKDARKLLAKIEKEWIRNRVLPTIIRYMDDEAKAVVKMLKSQMSRKFSTFVHDFNNLIAVVCGNIYMARMSLKEEKYEDIEKYLSDIENVALSSGELIINANSCAVCSDKKLKDLIDSALKAVDNKRVGKVAFWSDIVPMTIRRNSSDLFRIIMNIIGNAYDAMAEKKYEDGQQQSLKIYSSISESSLVIEIDDNGIGMSEETVQRIFEENFSTKKERGGKGIGLHFCQGIIRTMGGRIGVKSNPGHKTTFILQIPLEAIQ